MLCLHISDIAIKMLIIIHNSKSEGINLLESAVLEDCGNIYKTVLIFSLLKTVFSLLFLVYIKWLY